MFQRDLRLAVMTLVCCVAILICPNFYPTLSFGATQAFDARPADRVAFSSDMPARPLHAEDMVIPEIPDKNSFHDVFKGEVVKVSIDHLVSYIQSKNYKISDIQAKTIASAVLEYASQYDISPLVVISLMNVESSYRATVVSDKGAVGLMQVMPDVWIKGKQGLANAGIAFSRNDLFSVRANVRAGVHILAHYRDMALQSGIDSPDEAMSFALTRYLGGTENLHAEKTYARVREVISHIRTA